MSDRGADAAAPAEEAAAAAARYYCHHCRKEVAVDGSQDAMQCTECASGFIEELASVNLAPQRQRRTEDAGVPLEDAHLQPHHMLYVVRMLLENARANRHHGTHHGSHHGDGAGEHHGAGDVQGDNADVAQGTHGEVNLEVNSQVYHEPDFHDDHRPEDHSEDDSDSDGDGGLRLELEGYDDEEDWEETGEDEWGDGGAGNLLETALEAVAGGGNHDHPRNANPMDARTARENLTFYMREIFQSLVEQNVEVRVELPDMYLGNPGDYLDSRGFEQLLQQLAENDNTRRGAPPASKVAVEQLEMVKIEQHHIDSGIAMCAICKELLAIDEPAKQLPCLHLYHQDCILPWLSSRNSCPVCRYELPTDDPDYEEQKKSRRTESTTGENGSVATEEDQTSDRGQNSGSSVSASDETCRDEEEEPEDESETSTSTGGPSEASPSASSPSEASEDEDSEESVTEEIQGLGFEDKPEVQGLGHEGLGFEDKPEVQLMKREVHEVQGSDVVEGSGFEDLATEVLPARKSINKWLIIGPLISIAGLVVLSLGNHAIHEGMRLFPTLFQVDGDTAGHRYWWSFL